MFVCFLNSGPSVFSPFTCSLAVMITWRPGWQLIVQWTKAIIWTSDGPVYLRIYASLSLDMLNSQIACIHNWIGIGLRNWWGHILLSIFVKVTTFLSLWRITLQWRHNGHHGVSNHLHSTVCSTICLSYHQRKNWRPVDFPHKWPVTRKTFPWNYVIMIWMLGHVTKYGLTIDVLYL